MSRLAVFALALLVPTAASAHKPSYSLEGQFASPETAYVVDDLDVSIVVYHQVFCGDGEQLWMEFDAEAGQELYLQLGVPLVSRLVTYRPDVAVIAPGLPAPEAELPFDVPEGFGVLHFPGDAMPEESEIFYEPFTQTESWVRHESTRPLPDAGGGWIVSWHPEGTTGKLWVATGTVEDFGSDDFANMGDWIRETRAFHETAGELDVSEDVCAPPAEAATGCSVAPGHAGLGLLLLTPWVRRRR